MGAKKNMRPKSLKAIFFLFFINITTAQAQSCADDLTEDSPVKDVIHCLKSLDSANSKLRDRISRVESVGIATDLIPRGAVMLFSSACPRGKEWSPYEPASGKFVMGARVIGGRSGLGAGDGGGTIFNIRPLDTNLSRGGYPNQETLLKIDIHSPLFSVPLEDMPKEFRNEDRKFYILPPFTVLQYCEKQ